MRAAVYIALGAPNYIGRERIGIYPTRLELDDVFPTKEQAAIRVRRLRQKGITAFAWFDYAPIEGGLACDTQHQNHSPKPERAPSPSPAPSLASGTSIGSAAADTSSPER